MAEPRETIKAAWDAWMKTDDHLHRCAAFGEGQWCCIEPETQFTGGVAGAQGKLLDMAFEALRNAGYVVVARTSLADPDKLEEVADWLDTYDELAEQWMRFIRLDDEKRKELLETFRSKEVQEELRAWASAGRDGYGRQQD